MLRNHLGKVLFVAALAVAVPAPSMAGISIGVGIGIGLGVSVNIGPPALPVYSQPPCLVAGTLWTPGYWGWGPAGYYWVPGTWVTPPAVGLLWTPGYWGQGGGQYAWHPGYWGPHIGFYGGLNYGYGYFGSGYVGGGWAGNVFRYNTAVSNVNANIVRNVYVNKTVVNNYYNNTTVNRVSYNGGPGGIAARPTPQELTAQQERRSGLEPAQAQHLALAAQNRNLLASVNGGHPAQPAVEHPYSEVNRPRNFAPVQAADRQQATRENVNRGSLGNTSAANRAPATVGHAPALDEQRGTARSTAWDRFNSQRGTPANSGERSTESAAHSSVDSPAEQRSAHVNSADGFNAAGNRRTEPSYAQSAHQPSYAQPAHEPSYAQSAHEPSYAQSAHEQGYAHQSSYAQSTHAHTYSQAAHMPNYSHSGNSGGYAHRTQPGTYAHATHAPSHAQRTPQGSTHTSHAPHEPAAKERRG